MTAFAIGATLVVVPAHIYGGDELAALLRREQVTHLFSTPAALASAAGVPCAACVLELDPGPETAAGDPHVQRRAVSTWLRRLPGRIGGAPALTAVGGLG